MKTLLNLIFVFLVSQNTLLAQQTADTRVNKAIDSLLKGKYTLEDPGIAVLVAKKGRIIYRKAFGSANLELKVPMQPEMLFNLASITKQFTAVAILQLIENGKLSLKDSIQQYIPNFPSKAHTITIENLLTHTSGLKDYLQINYNEPFLERKDFEPKELIEYFKNQPLEFEPGTKYKYSNSGYFLLGYIIEMVSGKTYEKYLQDHIFNVLGLKNTYYDNSNRILANRTNGYKKIKDYEKADYWAASIPYAAGGLISNVDDLFAWHNGLQASILLKKQTLAKAYSPFRLKNGIEVNYGYGWIIGNTNNQLSIAHGGAITGYHNNEIYYPNEDIYIVTLSNCECTPIFEISTQISNLVLSKPLQQSTIKVDESILNQYIGVYALMTDNKRKIKIVKENGALVAYNTEKYELVFLSDRKFEFKGILDAKCEFIFEHDQVIKLMVTQNGLYEWKKIQ
jgi:CubicO group peptidase (beta-lactamase class C family)